MSKIKVLLRYPWSFTDSPYYRYLKNGLPKEIILTESKKINYLLINPKKINLLKKIKDILRNTTTSLKISKPNIHYSCTKDFNLIHCAHCLSSNNFPWVVDIEGMFQLYLGAENSKVNEKVEQILLDKNCKKIMPWTENLRKELEIKFPKIKNKLEVVYPAVPIQQKKSKKKKNKVNLLFVGRYFYLKGGLHALEVISKLTKKYNFVNGIIISDTPKEIIEKYSENKKIKFYPLMNQAKLKSFYKTSDIFIYPGYTDSFGFCFLEAMSFGIPIITVDSKNRNEIVENKKTGIIIKYINEINYESKDGINRKIIENILKATEKLITNNKLRQKMSKNAFNEIKSGKFSIKERNKKLLKIYQEAIQ